MLNFLPALRVLSANSTNNKYDWIIFFLQKRDWSEVFFEELVLYEDTSCSPGLTGLCTFFHLFVLFSKRVKFPSRYNKARFSKIVNEDQQKKLTTVLERIESLTAQLMNEALVKEIKDLRGHG